MLDDEVEDYMSDIFIAAAEKQKPGIAKSRTEKRVLAIDRNRTSNNALSRSQEEQARRSRGLGQEVGPENKGFHLLVKMGYSPGKGLGKNAEGRKAPVEIDLPDARSGLGLKAAKSARMAEASLASNRQAESELAAFRQAMTSRFEASRTQSNVKAAQSICQQLDQSAGLDQPTSIGFWRPPPTDDDGDDYSSRISNHQPSRRRRGAQRDRQIVITPKDDDQLDDSSCLEDDEDVTSCTYDRDNSDNDGELTDPVEQQPSIFFLPNQMTELIGVESSADSRPSLPTGQSENSNNDDPSSHQTPPLVGVNSSPSPSSLHPNPVDIMLSDLTALPHVIFKSQSRDEPDLTKGDKLQLVEDLLHHSPALFLERYGLHLDWGRDRVNFVDSDSTNTDQVNMTTYHVNRLDHMFGIVHANAAKHRQSRKYPSDRIRRNRRLMAVRRLDLTDDPTDPTSTSTTNPLVGYFSHEAMRKRDPVAWEAMVGRYLTDQRARQACLDYAYSTFSGFLTSQLLEHQQGVDYAEAVATSSGGNVGQETRGQDSDDDDNEEDDDCSSVEEPSQSSSEKNQRAIDAGAEFLDLMKSRFIAGQDIDFDYSIIDNDESYDNLAEQENDEQEAYFDAD